jgi:hypothetical protein
MLDGLEDSSVEMDEAKVCSFVNYNFMIFYQFLKLKFKFKFILDLPLDGTVGSAAGNYKFK